jgi:hypothetical protein
MIRILLAAGLSLLFAVPAHAEGVIALPDPSGVTLLALGITGLLVGRHIAGKRPKD